LKTVSMHQSSLRPEPYSYVEVEFWAVAGLDEFNILIAKGNF
jgi:hypothetical protein